MKQLRIRAAAVAVAAASALATAGAVAAPPPPAAAGAAAASAPRGARGPSFGALARATAADGAAVSSNWSGYAVTTTDGTTGYRAVTATWVQPAAACVPGQATYSAFWVGLGGFSEASQALEQIGTSANCTAGGKRVAEVWYEIVPAPSVPVKLKLAAGDTIQGTVVVDGTRVTLRIRNVTRKTTFTKRVAVAAPDVTSAEWVTEAPATCTSNGPCRVLP